MPLHDHFHAPLKDSRPWEAVHSSWAVKLSDQLNESMLPKGYVAMPHVHRRTAVEIDVATVQTAPTPGMVDGGWTVPEPVWTVPVKWNLDDLFEVRIINVESQPRLVAAIDLVSPANKDRPAHRRSFAGKCAGLLRQSISLIVVDVVTDRHDSLHQELLDLLELNGSAPFDAKLYAIAYRTIETGQFCESNRLEIWAEALMVGAALPTLPLWLTDELAVPVNFETAYQRTCQSLRMD